MNKKRLLALAVFLCSSAQSIVRGNGAGRLKMKPYSVYHLKPDLTLDNALWAQ